MERDPINNDARAERARRRQKGGAACVLCGVTDPSDLFNLARTILEEHHVVGRATDPNLTVPLCTYHHGLLTQALRCADVAMKGPGCALDRATNALKALGVFFPALGDACDGYAGGLEALRDALDKRYPKWRDLI